MIHTTTTGGSAVLYRPDEDIGVRVSLFWELEPGRYWVLVHIEAEDENGDPVDLTAVEEEEMRDRFRP